MSLAITLAPVTSTQNLKEFIRVPWSVYPRNSAWVPPLRLERRLHLAPSNPYFAHARWQAWIAWRGKQAVGRISAQIDRLYLAQHGRKVGFFGMLEAIDDAEVFARLTAQAESWLKAQGMEAVQGPYNLSINHECGLLIEGFDRPPAIMMPYNPPYYAAQLESLHYRKVKDLIAYLLEAETRPYAALRLADRAAEVIATRPLCRARQDREFELLRTIFNDAWADNWGFVPFTQEEFTALAKTLRFIVPDDFVQIAEIDGEAVGMIAALPDLNQLLCGLDGRLLPFNWLKLLWRWKTAYPDTARVILMGILRRYRSNLMGAAIAYRLIAALRASLLARGIRRVELSWILEDNLRMRGVIESLGAKAYKRYRIYEKPLR
ncbi:protein YghO [Methylothermus subterraneus]